LPEIINKASDSVHVCGDVCQLNSIEINLMLLLFRFCNAAEAKALRAWPNKRGADRRSTNQCATQKLMTFWLPEPGHLIKLGAMDM